MLGIVLGVILAKNKKDLDYRPRPLVSLERETGFEPVTLSLEG